MKIRVLVEVIEDNGRAMTRKMRQTSVSTKTLKLYEMMGQDDMVDFLAEDVISGALKAVQPGSVQSQAVAELDTKPATDDAGQPTGRTVMEEALGLDLIEHMMKKDGAGQAKMLKPGG